MTLYTGLSHKPRTTAAFTLIEMVVSLSIISIVFLAMGSVMLLAAKALPTGDDASSLTYDAFDITRQLTDELQTATEIALMTERVIMFKVPDRDGDDRDEMLAYSWSGTPGDPLLRNYNGGTAVKVLPSVQSFSLVYQTQSAPQPDMLEESAETELISYSSILNLDDADVEDNKWWGQYFKPTLPNDAVEWSVKRVKFRAKQDHDLAPVTVQLCLPDPGNQQPSSTVIDSTEIAAGALPAEYQWMEKSFTKATSISSSTGLFLVFLCNLDKPARVEYRNRNVYNSRLALAEGDADWQWKDGDKDRSMLFYVYGTYSTMQPQPPIDVLKSVAVTLNPDTEPATEVRSQVSLLNRPEVP